MQNVGLAIQVSSDTRQSVKGLQDVSSELGQMAKQSQETATTVDNSLKVIGDQARGTSVKFGLLNKSWEEVRKGSGQLGITLRDNQLIMSRTSSEVDKIVSSNRRLSDSQNNLSRTGVNANGALVGFSNIIRDAPYGINGVANNITQLSDSFSTMVKQTGSASKAFGQLFG